MSKPHTAFIVALGIAAALLATSATSPPAGAGDRPTPRSGGGAGGGGLTITSLSTPGPPLTVYVGDNVTLNLTSLDGFSHRWFIDYNGNNVSGGSEPTSPNFGTALLWNFTVSNVTGTYHYRSDRTAGPGDDLTTMWGNITISASPPSNPLLPGPRRRRRGVGGRLPRGDDGRGESKAAHPGGGHGATDRLVGARGEPERHRGGGCAAPRLRRAPLDARRYRRRVPPEPRERDGGMRAGVRDRGPRRGHEGGGGPLDSRHRHLTGAAMAEAAPGPGVCV